MSDSWWSFPRKGMRKMGSVGSGDGGWDRHLDEWMTIWVGRWRNFYHAYIHFQAQLQVP